MVAETDTPLADADEQEKPKLTLQVKVDKPSSCKRHVTVTVSREDIDRYFSDAFDEFQPAAEVPGFRPGKAPRRLVESRFREQMSNQVKGSILIGRPMNGSDIGIGCGIQKKDLLPLLDNIDIYGPSIILLIGLPSHRTGR